MRQWRKAIYIMQSIDGIAGGLIGVFIPIYFLTLGFSLTQVFLYFIVLYMTVMVMFYVAGLFAARLGYVKTLVTHLLVLFVALALLYNLALWPAAFYLLAILFGTHIAFYWFPVNVIFAKAADEHALGQQVANLFALPSLVVLFVPLAGAAISAIFGFKMLIVIASAIYVVSIIPLMLAGDIPVEVKLTGCKIIDYCRRYKRYFGAEVLINAVSEAETYILPIFIYLTFNNILSIGAVAAFLGLGSAIFTLLVGRYADRVDRRKILRIGSVALVLVWLARYMSSTQVSFYVLSVLAGFFSVLINVPFTSIVFKNAKDNHVEDFTIFREIPVTIGRVLLYGTAILLVNHLDWSFLAVAGSLAALLLF